MSSIWRRLFGGPSSSSPHAPKDEEMSPQSPAEDRDMRNDWLNSSFQDLVLLAEGLDFIVTVQGPGSPSVTPIVKEIVQKARYLAAQEGKSLTALVGSMREQEARPYRGFQGRAEARHQPRLKEIEHKLNKLSAAVEEIVRYLECMNQPARKAARRTEPRVENEPAEVVVDSQRYNVANWSKHGLLFSVPDGKWRNHNAFDFRFVLKSDSNPLTFNGRGQPVRVANDTVAAKFSYVEPSVEEKVDRVIKRLSTTN